MHLVAMLNILFNLNILIFSFIGVLLQFESSAQTARQQRHLLVIGHSLTQINDSRHHW